MSAADEPVDLDAARRARRPSQPSRRPKLHTWRDVDRSRPVVGFVLGRHGITVHAGRRLYRATWGPRG